MPLTAKGRKILRAMQKEYGPVKGKSVFYASLRKGRLTGVEAAAPARRTLRRRKGARSRTGQPDAVPV